MEQNIDIEKLAALALLDRGVAFRIPAPALLVLFGKKSVKIKVKRLRIGTLLHLSTLESISPPEVQQVPDEYNKLFADMGTAPRSLPISVILERQVSVCRAIAACLLNSRVKIALFSRLLGRYLRRSCTPDQQQELAMWLFAYGRAESFTITTKLLEKMKLTSLRN